MGLAAITGSHILITNAHYMSGGLNTWGWIMTILSTVQLLAAVGVWAGNHLARWFAVAVVGFNAIGQMFVIPACPFWSLVIIAADVVALWGLCAHGNLEDPGAAQLGIHGGAQVTSPQPRLRSMSVPRRLPLLTPI